MERFPYNYISARFRMSNSGRALWKLPEMSTESEGANVGSIRARFSLSSASGCSPTTVTAHFGCDGSTLSGAEMELMSPAYRTSLVKRRFVAGSVHHLHFLPFFSIKIWLAVPIFLLFLLFQASTFAMPMPMSKTAMPLLRAPLRLNVELTSFPLCTMIVWTSHRRIQASKSQRLRIYTLDTYPTANFIPSVHLLVLFVFKAKFCFGYLLGYYFFLLKQKKKDYHGLLPPSRPPPVFISNKKAIGLSDCFVSCSLVPFRFTSSMQIRSSFVVTKWGTESGRAAG